MRLVLGAKFSKINNLGCDPYPTLSVAALLPTIVARLEGSTPPGVRRVGVGADGMQVRLAYGRISFTRLLARV